ncbi:MAG: CHAT domain-containing protein, partial [Myxococcales bacterium]|nr:CHAT domain-containing protein [Myxococcales bacterium]
MIRALTLALLFALSGAGADADDRALRDALATGAALVQQNRMPEAYRVLAEAEARMPARPGLSAQELRAFLTNLTYATFNLPQTPATAATFARLATRAEALLGPDDKLTLVNLYNASVAAYNLDRFAESADFLERALPRYERVYGPNHPETYEILLGLADARFVLQQHDAAVPLRRRVLEVAQHAFGTSSPETLEAMEQLGWALVFTFKTAEAEAFARRLLDERDALKPAGDDNTVKALSLLAETLRLQMALAEAERIQRRLVALCETLYGPNNKRTLEERSRLAATLNNLGRSDEAIDIQFDTHDRLLHQQGPKGADRLDAAFALASILAGAGRQTEARRLYEEVLASSDPVRRPVEHAQLLNALALSYQRTGDFARAEPLGREALRLAASDPNQPAVAATIGATLGMTLAALGEDAEADRLLAQSGDRLRTLFGADNYLANVDAAGRAAIALRSGRPADALTFARLALQADRTALRAAASQADATRAWWNDLAGGSGGMLARAAFDLSRRDPAQEPALFAEAFAAVQMAQGAAAEAMRRSAARVSTADEALSADVRQWEETIAARLSLDRSTASNPDASMARTARRADLDRAIGRLETRIATRSPGFFNLVLPAPVDAAAARVLLHPGEALILLRPGGTNRPGLVFALTRDGQAWASLPWTRPDLAAEIATLRRGLETPALTRGAMSASGTKRAPGFDRQRAFALYRSLFGDPQIATLLANKPDWIVIPDGPFLSLPLAALVTEPPTGADTDADALRATAWLGTARALSVLPSLASLRQLRRNGHRPATDQLRVFALGDPAFSGSLGSDEAPRGTTALLAALPRLPGTWREAQGLAARFGAPPGNLLLGPGATETALARASTEGRLAKAEVVLIATHGLLARPSEGLTEPALALSPPAGPARLIDPLRPGQTHALALAEGARLDDGLLTASEAARLSFRGLVILSACDTAASGRADAEGLSGLARAFFFAGAEALVVSH